MRFGGIGTIYALPSGANPTPIPIAVAKSAVLTIAGSLKFANGQWQAPIDAMRTDSNISVKLANADFRASALAMLLPGATTSVGSNQAATGEAFTIPTTPFQVTVSQSATFVEDGGVLDLSAGKWLDRVASAPATGQYSVAAGVYTFAAADTGHSITIAYLYNSATVGKTTSWNNQVMGASTGYLVRVFQVYLVAGVLKSVGFKLPNVHFANLSINYKNDDFAEQSLEGRAIQDVTTTKVIDAYVGE